MISISTLYCGRELASHRLRYAPERGGPIVPAVVVYNCTARCNLACAHCYSAATRSGDDDELTTGQARSMLADLARMGVSVVLFSGGEPTGRADLPELIASARAGGMRAVISSNGTTITPPAARTLAEAGVAYAGISLDGLRGTHDRFRGQAGAFEAALAGMAACRDAGVKVGLRMTLTRRNVGEIAGVFDLLARQRIPRVCFYHLVYTGRGRNLRDEDLTHDQRRGALDAIMDLTAARHAAGEPLEVLTVDNHADGPYVYLRLLREDPARAARALELLRLNGGNASGWRLACVRANGDVLPDQFWHNRVLGNVRRRPFSEIWADESDELLAALRRRPRPLTGRCVRCRWLEVCNGNFPARTEAATGTPWGDDPACYLTDEEISPQR